MSKALSFITIVGVSDVAQCIYRYLLENRAKKTLKPIEFAFRVASYIGVLKALSSMF